MTHDEVTVISPSPVHARAGVRARVCVIWKITQRDLLSNDGAQPNVDDAFRL